MFTANTQVRVRYAETDQMGYVYYGNYAMYFEVARVEALRQIGYSYRNMEENGVMMPVLEHYSRYFKPGKYDELLTIKVEIQKMPSVKVRFDYSIYNEAEELIHQGHTILTFIKKESHRPCRPPQDLVDLLEAYF
ncbi:thioesterase [Echinicola pacifica]|uniref:Thioesterase n=1 Tax=Echinicola pacifica TaxID=346377 RepID=A0A918Q9C5_9BACT|nr:thioesterase family protein [Echinicola pacifica]GGZ35818.1 thioesterase [Echinicola pacifica]